MKKLFENAISKIEELSKLRERQILLLNNLQRTKEITALNFKIKYYTKWVELLKVCIEKEIMIETKEDIIDLKLTKSLENNLIELFETGEIKDIEDTKNAIQQLEKQNDEESSLFNSMNSAIDQEESPKLKQPPTSKKQLDVSKSKKLDTSKIEAQPKLLADEQRPTDARGAAMFDLRYVYGIGPKNAEKLVDMNITLEKLLEDWTQWIKRDSSNAILMLSRLPIPKDYTKSQWDKLHEDRQFAIQSKLLHERLSQETTYLSHLTGHQLLGIKYFHDMSQKIPREEVQRAERILKGTAQHMNKDIQVTLCGSYRRGRPKSGDIDCLITHPDIKTLEDLDTNPTNLLAKYVEVLTKLDFIVDHLTEFGKSKYMGFCLIKQTNKKTNTVRRIDIRCIPADSYGAAILYFTGSKNFNTQMRSHALNKGYSLNEYGLKRLKDNVLIPCKTEEEVFKILDYPYKKPEERDI